MTEKISKRIFSLEDMPPVNIPKRTNLVVTNWCRISWYGPEVGPPFRFHFVWVDGPHLWFKLFRLDAAFHKYSDDGYPRKVFPWLAR